MVLNIAYPRWLYDFALDLFSNFTDDMELAFKRLPHMTDSQVRAEVESGLKRIPEEYRDPNEIMPLIWDAHQLIERALNNAKKPCVMVSFGKDSTTVLHLVLQHTRNVHVLWNNTKVEFKETVDFARRIVHEWQIENFIEVIPKGTNFWKIVQTEGLPFYGRQHGQAKDNKGDRASTVCCRELKKKPTKQAIKEHGFDLTITGITRYESDIRELSARQRGDYFYSKYWGGYRCHPILNWTEEMVYLYHSFYRLPINDLYRPIPSDIDAAAYIQERDEWKEGRDFFDWEDQWHLRKLMPGYKARVGCAYCGINFRYGGLRYLRLFQKERFNTLIRKHGIGKILLFKKLKIDEGEPRLFDPPPVEEILERKPCFFDKF